MMILLAALAAVLTPPDPVTASVSYDHKAIIIDGQRRILIFGSIHYPRSIPEMWPDLIQKAKDGGLDVIQTYVFWNGHEPSPGQFWQYYFEDRYDLVKFIKLVHQAGLYVNLRIGPYACAEWNFGYTRDRLSLASPPLDIDFKKMLDETLQDNEDKQNIKRESIASSPCLKGSRGYRHIRW